MRKVPEVETELKFEVPNVEKTAPKRCVYQKGVVEKNHKAVKRGRLESLPAANT
jgi:hypothetical protein